MLFLKHVNTVKIISDTYGIFVCDGHSCKCFTCVIWFDLHDKSKGEYYYHLIYRSEKMKIYKCQVEYLGQYLTNYILTVVSSQAKSLFLKNTVYCLTGLPCWLQSKEYSCNAGAMDSVPGLRWSPREGNSNPFQYCCLGNAVNRGAWWATVHGVTKHLDTT